MRHVSRWARSPFRRVQGATAVADRSLLFFWDHKLNADPRVLPMAEALAELDVLVRSPEEPDRVLGVVELVDPDFEETLRTLREQA
jgi:hypothetical protein